MIVGRPPITAAAAELLVPRSIPMIFGKDVNTPQYRLQTAVWEGALKNIMGISYSVSLFCVVFGRLTTTKLGRMTVPFNVYPVLSSSTRVFSGFSFVSI